MKQYKQILEAVNKGVKFALDDFEVNNTLDVKAKDKVINKDESLNDAIDFYVNKVNLGLPSGTLWCKYNVGVNIYELDNAEDWYGNYYAWGEIYPKRTYGFYNYEYAKYNENQTEDDLDVFTKYCSDSHFSYDGTTDNLSELEKEDMPINVKLRKGDNKNNYSMPTYEQYAELINHTNSKYVKNYNKVSNLNGVLFISKINGKSIFFPCTGFKEYNEFNENTTYYWSSSIVDGMDPSAWSLKLNLNKKYNSLIENARVIGFPIRLIYNRQ